MRNIQIAAFRGRDPDNPSDRKHPSCGRFRQRMEINVLGHYKCANVSRQG